jgi:hypothetical protein
MGRERASLPTRFRHSRGKGRQGLGRRNGAKRFAAPSYSVEVGRRETREKRS